jgi:hypothetical protein
VIPNTEQIKEFARSFAEKSKVESPDEQALHAYTDVSGNPLYWRVRVKNTGTGEKWIRPFYHDGKKFKSGEPPKPDAGKPLYGLHLMYARSEALVWIAEGEKAADALNTAFAAWNVDMQHVATTSGGMSSASSADWMPLSGRRVIVWPDNDEPGAKYAGEVSDKLQSIAASVQVVDVAALNLPAKGDAFDWIAAGEPLGALQALLDEAQEDEPVPNDETEEQTIARLAKLSPLEYERVRTAEANRLGVRATAIDAQVRRYRKESSDSGGVSFEDVEPWHEPIQPDALLTEIAETVTRFIVCQQETADAVALWVAMTWFIDVVQVAPLAVITAPEKRCGKSQLLFLLGRLSCRPLTASNISPAALFRVIDAWKPTLLVDEADAFMRDNEELRGLLNCGHTRDSAYTVRIVGEAMTPTRFNVWGAKALAGIGHLADTLMDRSVTLELRRKMEHETVERLRHAEPGLFDELSAKLARFAEDCRIDVRYARPNLPKELNDRAQDNWEPLLAIADIAGAGWSDRGRRAALKLSGAHSMTESVGSELLADIQEVFEQKHLAKISTASLIEALCEDEERGWTTYNRGRPLSPRQLSKKLDGYGVQSKNIRSGASIQKGFDRAQFEDAFARYLTLPGKNAISPLQTPEAPSLLGCGVADDSLRSARNPQPATLEAPSLLGCSGVAYGKGETQDVARNVEVEL